MENSFGERNRAQAARVSGLGGRTETELFVVHAAALRDAAALPATCFLVVKSARGHSHTRPLERRGRQFQRRQLRLGS